MGLLLGRVLGLFRDLLIAGYYGRSEQADIAIVLLTFPDLMVGLLTGGALTYVLVPEFARISGKGSAEVRAAFVHATLIALGTFLALAGLGWVLSSELVWMLAPGFRSEANAEASKLLRWVVFALPLAAASGVATSYLQFRERFGINSLQNVIYNLVLVIALWTGLGSHLPTFAAGILVAALVRWLVLAVDGAVGSEGKGSGGRSWHFAPGLLKRYFESLAGGSLILLLPVAARQVASLEGGGSLALMNYALKALELPGAVFIGVFSTAVFPRLSLQHHRGEKSPLAGRAIAAVFGLSVLLAAICSGVSYWVSTHPFAWKDFDSESMALLGHLLVWGFWALPALGTLSMTTAVFGARQDMSTPFRLSLMAVLLFLPAAWLAQRSLGLFGIMVSYIGVQYFVLGSHLMLLRRR
jgi:putative peptidoglycan lipid II flippase